MGEATTEEGQMTGFDETTIARMFDVPPWLVQTGYPVPRFARARWRLRRIWPGLVWPQLKGGKK
jgi:hypothetical protein